jgi:transposase
MRKGFDSLSGLVREGLNKDPLSGDVFIFFNKRCSQVKLLLWEMDGFSVYYKRLERGTYELPAQSIAEIRSDELMLILQGISLKSIRRRRRFELDKNNFKTSHQNSFING